MESKNKHQIILTLKMKDTSKDKNTENISKRNFSKIQYI